MNEQEKQWLTGFTEGDGSVGLYLQNQLTLRVSFSQKERDVLEYVQSLTQRGHFQQHHRGGFITNHQSWTFSFYGKSCEPLLTTFSKYVVSKHFQERLNVTLIYLKLPPAVLHEPTLDWLIGFFDAEGSSSNKPSIDIGQKERDVLVAIKTKFGGNIRPHNNTHVWYLNGNKARELAHAIVTKSHNPTKAERLLNYFNGPPYHVLHRERLTTYRQKHLAETREYNKKCWEEHKRINAYIKEHPEVVEKLQKQNNS